MTPFLLSSLLNLIGLYAFLHYARKQAILDIPNDRSSHTLPTVRGGGIGFAPTFVLASLWSAPSPTLQIALISLAVLLSSAISFIDDRRPLPARVRLPIHFFSVALLIYSVQPGWPWWGFALSLVLITGWLNTFNFMDGINGISAVYGLSLLATYMLMPYLGAEGQPEYLQPVAWAVAGAVAAFSYFNFRPRALCFAGDVGSISLALILAWGFLSYWQGATSIYMLAFPLLYAIDSVLTIVVRISRKENIFKPHRSHFYQLLANEWKVGHRSIALGYGTGQLLINAYATRYWAGLSPEAQLSRVILLYLLGCALYLIARKLLEVGHRNAQPHRHA